MRHFRQVFHEVMEFTVINAPFECEDNPPRELQKKFLSEQDPNQKFKSWLKFHSWLPTDEQKFESPDVVFGHEEIVDYLIDVI